MNIQSKFILMCGASILLVIGVATINFYNSIYINSKILLLNDITNVVQRHMNCDMMHDAMRSDTLEGAIKIKENDKIALVDSRNALENDYNSFKNDLNTNLLEQKLPTDIKKDMNDAAEILTKYYKFASQVFNEENNNLNKNLQEFKEAFEEMETFNAKISDKLLAWSEINTKETAAAIKTNNYILSVVSILEILIVFLIPIFARKILFVPQNKLIEVMKDLANGKLDCDIPGSERLDEIGKIAQAMIIFKNNAIDKVNLARLQHESESQSELKRKQAIEEQENIIKQEISVVLNACIEGNFTSFIDTKNKEGLLLHLSESMNKINTVCNNSLNSVKKVLQNLAKGDLTQIMEGNFKGVFVDIQNDLNHSIKNLSQMVNKIAESSNSVASAANEIANGGKDLAMRTEQQAATVAEIASNINQISNSIKENANGATSANNLSRKASDVAENGKLAVKEVSQAMEDINNSSNKIVEVISLIDDIAFQTNLLALNAAVEAARAGETGKGFAVVAAEVRVLAGRASEAANEIRKLIMESSLHVERGTNLSNNASLIILEIVESVNNVSKIIGRIANLSQEQSVSTNEINTAISKIDDATQQNAAMVEENAASSQAVQEQTKELNNLVSIFKTN